MCVYVSMYVCVCVCVCVCVYVCDYSLWGRDLRITGPSLALALLKDPISR